MEIKELEIVLKETLDNFNDKKSFSYVGFIGSLNLERDIDLLILPTKEEKEGQFIKKLDTFIERVRKKLSKRKIKLVTFVDENSQEETEWISKINKKKDIFLHLISIFGWQRPHQEVKQIILKAIRKGRPAIQGSIEEVNNLPLGRFKSKDWRYIGIFYANCLWSYYPKKLEKYKIDERTHYISKHLEVTIKANTSKQKLYKLCDEADRLL